MSFKNYKTLVHRKISDLNSDGYILEHEKTKARVVLLLNDDDNKVFYIGFRTPVEDSTGVPHILEHSVLCGSDEFPAKDPFIELAKGSLNTFLNAMTYPDKTVYPVASCNDKDFHNLVHVYLDAVFHPNIYKHEEIFKQEGWHYEMESVDGDLTVNGVVYNEMKGVFSSPDDVVSRHVMNSLYPDVSYGFESGGDPECIPTLTYEEFLDFHSRYYHPSNSYIYLYGNLDPNEYLDFIDSKYLSKYEYLEVDSKIKLQKPFATSKMLNNEYSVLEDDESSGTYLTYNVSIGTSLDPKRYLALDILDYVLCSSPGAVLKEALIKAGIGEDVYNIGDTGIFQPYIGIVAKNAKEEQKDTFVSIIESTLKNLVEKGIDRKSLIAAISRAEFRYREADFGSYPKGLVIGLQALDSWLYDDMAPFMHIEANDTFKALREEIDKGYFENLITEYILNNSHKTIMTVNPAKGLTEKVEAEFKKNMDSIKNSLSKKELSKIVEDTKALKAYQSEPSSEEDLKKIPMLGMEDLGKEARKSVNSEEYVDDTLILHHDIFTNGIGYLTFLFKLNDIDTEYLPYVSLLTEFLGAVNTKEYTYKELSDENNIHTGGLSFGVRGFVKVNDRNDVSEYLTVRTKMLYPEMKKAIELIKEIALNSDLTDTIRLLELLNEARMNLSSSMISSGHSTASARAMSYFSKLSAIDEFMNGVPYLRLLEDLTSDFENKKDELCKKLMYVSKKVFNSSNLFVDYTGDKETLEELKGYIREFKDSLGKEPFNDRSIEIDISQKNEGFITAGQVQYVCRAGNYKYSGDLPYTGALKVLRTILAYDYLWNNIRVLGGAYGCMSTFGYGGDSYLVSYRDPNLSKTVEVYEKAAEYIANMPLDDRMILQFVIGTLSGIDTPLTPNQRGGYSLSRYMIGFSDEDAQKERDEILNVTPEIIHGLSRYLEAILKDNNFCVVGSSKAINDSKDMFKAIEQLSK